MDPTPPSAAAVGMQHLPDEILVEIFSNLTIQDLWWVSFVCRRWQGLVKSHHLLSSRVQKLASVQWPSDVKHLVTIAYAMPPLETLHLSFDGNSRVEVAWLKVYLNIPSNWVPKCVTCPFITENLILDYFPKNDILSSITWVRLRTLKTVHLCKGLSNRQINMAVDAQAKKIYSCNFLGDNSNPESVRFCLSNDALEGVFTMQQDARAAAYQKALYEIGVVARKGVESPQDVRAAAYREALREVEETAGGGNAVLCPALEEVTVSCEMERVDLETLCRLGPLRVLRLEQCAVDSLAFLLHCAGSLEELLLGDCSHLPDAELTNLRHLKSLRVLKLSKFCFDESFVYHYIQDLPRLECVEVSPPD